MSFRNFDYNFDDLETMFDPMNSDRQARRKRKGKAHHKAKKSADQLRAELTDPNDSEDGSGGWQITYQPSRFESEWLMSSLQPFFYQELITDVLMNVKGGKEASVYCCEAHPNVGEKWLAAKVYRPHIHRQFRNDAVYREGRDVLTADGHAAKKTDHRLMRALGKKSTFGREVAHTSWLMYEYTTMQHLYKLGASVPLPISSAENAILMQYYGDDTMAAPLLQSVTLESRELVPLFNKIIWNIELMLQNDFVHGDLSAYNILYWQDDITLIDFPQVTNARNNRQARSILQRDITRICEYFEEQGLSRSPGAITYELWNRYFAVDIKQQLADESRLLEAPQDEYED